jgi:branched-chain amino acid transport system permease protein
MTQLLKSLLPIVVGVAFALAMHLLIAPHIDSLYAKILLDIGINVILAVSLNIVNGMTGQFSIGHAGFMVVGGYTAAIVTYYGSFALFGDAESHGGLFSWPLPFETFKGSLFASGDALFLVACVAGGVTAALLGFLVGLPSLRLRGDYLAIVTLGFGEIVRVLVEQSQPQPLSLDEVRAIAPTQRLLHLGGALGFTQIPFYTTQFWVWLFVAATLIVAYRLRQSTYGRAFFSIRENAIAAEAMGVPITRYKVAAFVIAAFFAGIAGALFAHQVGVTLNPGELGFQKSFDILIMVVLGGLGSISGSVVAAALLTILPELLRNPPHVWPAGLLVVVLVLAVRRSAGMKAALGWAGAVVAWEIGRGVALAHNVDLSKYRMIFYALALILLMLLRPRGLFGAREAWELWRPGAKNKAGEPCK